MQDELILYKTAKLAKEKGFNEFYYAFYYDKDGNDWMGFSSNSKDYDDKYVKSSQSLLAKWLREKHNLHIEISLENFADDYIWQYQVLTIGVDYTTLKYNGEFKTYEEALEEGLLEALKLI